MYPKPSILIIENSADLTGALKSIIQTSYSLRSFFDFTFVIPKGSKGRFWIEEKGFALIYELPMLEISRRFTALVLYLPILLVNSIRLMRIVSRKKISLIHTNDIYNLLPIVIRLLGNSTPYICHIRFMPDRFPHWLFNFWIRLHFKYSLKIVVVSESVARMLPSHPKIVIKYDGLSIEEQYQVTQINRSGFTFLYLSNFMIGKGQNFCLDSFAKIHKTLPDWKLRFVGGHMGLKKNKSFINRLKLKSREYGISEKIEWVEFTKDVEWEYKQADIVLNFSESESFSLTCLEALYYGRPLIASDSGGPGEIIVNNVTGVLVPNRDSNSMAAAMIKMAFEKDRREVMSMAARTDVRKKFSAENASYGFKELYDQMLTQH